MYDSMLNNFIGLVLTKVWNKNISDYLQVSCDVIIISSGSLADYMTNLIQAYSESYCSAELTSVVGYYAHGASDAVTLTIYIA